MKITKHFLLLTCGLLTTLSTLTAQNDLESSQLKGDIESISTTVYRTAKRDGKVVLQGVSQKSEEAYNKAGYMTSLEYQINTRILGEGPKRKKVYELDKKNRCIAETNYKNEEKGLATKCRYDRKGNLVEVKYYEGGEKYLGTQFYTYDKKGNKTLNRSTDAEGKTLEKYEYTYTKDNKLASLKKTKGGALVTYSKYSYPSDLEEKIMSIELVDGEEKVTDYMIKTYDANKNVLSSIDYTAEGKIDKKHINKYNEQGDLILRQVFNAQGEEESYNYMRYEYRYDDKGNWIQKVEFLKNGNSLDATSREIKYY